MILLTVGTQLSFDRLTRAVDEWLSDNPSSIEVIGQIGPADYAPKSFRAQKFFEPEQMDSIASSVDLVISHAGMGSIITALTKGKPIIIVPRLAGLGEHRNDHQLATARKFIGHSHVRPVFELDELGTVVMDLLKHNSHSPISPFAPESMTNSLKSLINF